MTKNCKNCGCIFSFSEDDKKLLDKFSLKIGGRVYAVSDPSMCYKCRLQRRMAFRNEHSFYLRNCDYSKEECISLYDSSSDYTIYKDSSWWSDSWSSKDYYLSLSYDIPFFQQLDVLFHLVPRKSMQQNGVVENCEFTSYTSASKNCYLLSSSGYCEDVYYSNRMIMAKNCMDCSACVSSELLYESTDCHNCYNSLYLKNCAHCQDSYFLENCRNVHHSIACKNLRSKGYHIFNKPVSKEEFEFLKSELILHGFEEMKKKFKDFSFKLPNIYGYFNNTENCSGNMIENSSDCHNCFSILLGGENIRYSEFCGWKGKDMMDCLGAGKESELLYEATAVITSQKIAFSCNIESSSNCYYSEGLRNCHNCFGCIGLTGASYCILNKQYSQEEYEDILPKIIKCMQLQGEWGENMPINISPFPYNDSIAHVTYPITQSQAKEKGYKWQNKEKEATEVKKKIPGDKLPVSIKDIPDDVLNWAILCSETSRPFLITPHELSLCRKMGIPIPRLHPSRRHSVRENSRLPSELFYSYCTKCSAEIHTCYNPSEGYIVYCESCFHDEIYNSLDGNYGESAHSLNQETLYQLKSSYRKYSKIASAIKTTIINKNK